MSSVCARAFDRLPRLDQVDHLPLPCPAIFLRSANFLYYYPQTSSPHCASVMMHDALGEPIYIDTLVSLPGFFKRVRCIYQAILHAHAGFTKGPSSWRLKYLINDSG